MSTYSDCRELSVTDKFFILSSMDERELEKRVKALDVKRGDNLRRLRIREGWSQEKLSSKTGIGQTKISAYENGLGFDKETLIRFCEVFNVKEWEFDWDVSVPVIISQQEIADIKQRRESEKIGIADMVREAEASWITAAKKKEMSGGESASERVPRRTRKSR